MSPAKNRVPVVTLGGHNVVSALPVTRHDDWVPIFLYPAFGAWEAWRVFGDEARRWSGRIPAPRPSSPLDKIVRLAIEFTRSEIWSPLGRRYCADCGCVDMPIRRVFVDDDMFNVPLCGHCEDERLGGGVEIMCHRCGDWSRDVVGSECPECREKRIGGAS